MKDTMRRFFFGLLYWPLAFLAFCVSVAAFLPMLVVVFLWIALDRSKDWCIAIYLRIKIGALQ